MCRMPNTSVHWNAFLVPFLLRFNGISVWILGMWKTFFFGMACEYSSHWRLRPFFPPSSPSIYLPHRCDAQARLSLLMTPKRCALSPIETKMQDNGNGNPHFQCEKKNCIGRLSRTDNETLWIQSRTMDNRSETVRTKDKPFWNR